MDFSAREWAKRAGGWWMLRRGGPLFEFANGIFILAHMRCGSTALSNILCSRADVSGYGEAHISYDGRNALGRLALNQRRHGGWNPDATHLFDKILHSRHDVGAPVEFFTARAIFMLREPEPAIRSIQKLFTDLGHGIYRTPEAAAEYYAERVETLALLWDRFAPDRRVGLTHGGLLHDPDAALAAISQRLAFAPPLRNQYESKAASRRGGGGDPTQSGKHSRIETTLLRPARPLAELGLPADLAARVEAAHAALQARFAADLPALAS